MIDRVFVYGTLMRGGAYHGLVAPYVRDVGPGWIPGLLVDLGEYPGWVPGAGRVHGQVLRVRPVEPVLRLLDELEEYEGPGSPANVYERTPVRVGVPGGRVTAWAYRYVGPAEGRPVVPGGRWPGSRWGGAHGSVRPGRSDPSREERCARG